MASRALGSGLRRLGGLGVGVAFGLGVSGHVEARTFQVEPGGLGKGLGGSWGLERFYRDWDKEHSSHLLGKNKSPASGRGVRSIVLVRHGQYYFDTGELTDLGVRQAKASSERVASLCKGLALASEPTSLVVSSATRAMQTSQPFTHTLRLKPEVDDQLRECWPCVAYDRDNTRPTSDVQRGHHQAEAAFRRVFRRPESAANNETVVVVAHANVIRYWTLRALQLPPEAWTNLSIPHCSITHIRVSASGNVNVRCVGDSGFLPPDMVTTNNVDSAKS